MYVNTFGSRNIDELELHRAGIIPKVDVEWMKNHHAISSQTFDRIIFNFLHATFWRDESFESMLM